MSLSLCGEILNTNILDTVAEANTLLADESL